MFRLKSLSELEAEEFGKLAPVKQMKDENVFTFNDIRKQGKELTKDTIFMVDVANNKSSSMRMVGDEQKLFVQVKVTKYMINDKLTTMLQLIDISSNIMYHQQKADTKFLELINACISHELRNPLNSIVAQNIKKTRLLAEL